MWVMGFTTVGYTAGTLQHRRHGVMVDVVECSALIFSTHRDDDWSGEQDRRTDRWLVRQSFVGPTGTIPTAENVTISPTVSQLAY